MDVSKTLEERGTRYGVFAGHANISQEIQKTMRLGYEIAHPNSQFDNLEDDVKESLFMIAHKIGRIINGDPYYDDSWRDIAGYAMLVANRLEKLNGSNINSGDDS